MSGQAFPSLSFQVSVPELSCYAAVPISSRLFTGLSQALGGALSGALSIE